METLSDVVDDGYSTTCKANRPSVNKLIFFFMLSFSSFVMIRCHVYSADDSNPSENPIVDAFSLCVPVKCLLSAHSTDGLCYIRMIE